MKIIVERSGGFAGAILRGERDGAALSPEQRQALERMLDEAPPRVPPGTGPELQADRFVYKVEMQDETGVRVMTVPEARMPPCLAGIAARSKD
ncbi:protealysin inhibitor emfourin [Methylocapsa aurea]|uniref:protealysin inhibitor emfourin n=1 Tax=Methylocapsa aurea TaxID=663610 RepID=UPI00056B0F0E|nr:protealysin inhibitor emfourin [Methylocapsa aurea]